MKKRGSEWDEDRKGRLAVAYKERREETWMPLAQQLGERWDHVEKVVGLFTIHAPNSAAWS